MVKVLITGGSGLLGRYLLRTVPDDVEVHATYNTNPQSGVAHYMDLCDGANVKDVFKAVKPDVVIHTAGEGSVDKCERDFHAGYGVNICGTYKVIDECLKHDAKFIGISSNAVFDGDSPPYTEADSTNPINYYGHTKVCMEWAVVRHYKPVEWLIVRPILLYGWPWPGGRENWATIAMRALTQDKKLNIVCDTMTQPTYAQDCAQAIWSLLGMDGIWNIGGATTMSLYDFVLAVARATDLDDALIAPVQSSFFPDIAPRPRDTTYMLTKLYAIGIVPDGVEDGLRRMLDE